MYKRKIGFDLDGVLGRTDRAMIKAAHRRGLLLNYTAEDINHRSLEVAFPGEISVSEITSMFTEFDFWLGIEPCPSLVTAVQRCKAEGLEIHIVTARFTSQHPQMTDITRAWLSEHEIPYDRLGFVDAKDKATYCLQYKLDTFVEDRLDTAQAIAKIGLMESYLVAMPYNEQPIHQDGLKPYVFRREREFFARNYFYLT